MELSALTGRTQSEQKNYYPEALARKNCHNPMKRTEVGIAALASQNRNLFYGMIE
jgi:hypothetical protein